MSGENGSGGNGGSPKFDGVNVYWGVKEIDGERIPVINAFYLKARFADDAELREQYGLPVWTKGTRNTHKYSEAVKRLIEDFAMERRKAAKGAWYEYVASGVVEEPVAPISEEAVPF